MLYFCFCCCFCFFSQPRLTLPERLRNTPQSKLQSKVSPSNDPAASMEKLEDALQLYSQLVRSSRSVEVSLFASFKLVEINVDSEAYFAKEMGSLQGGSNSSMKNSLDVLSDEGSLSDLRRCMACYNAEIDSLDGSFEAGCELDVQRQHVLRAVVHWKYLFGQLSYLESCKQYEDMFRYRQANFGRAHCHVSLVS